MTSSDEQTVTVESNNAARELGSRWMPEIGPETTAVLARMTDLDHIGRAKVRAEAVSILARCMPPTQPNAQTTGLILGQVQSGKTMSFTTVAALARDNGYRMVIVVAGTTIPLLDQSADRLQKDLGLSDGNRQWRHIACASQSTINREALLDALEEWRDPSVPPSQRRTVLITVMKQHQNLKRLIKVLKSISLGDVPALIIDDEADQASLNTKVRSSSESTTYSTLRDLRDCLPRHTFLQYTATPQALLLVSIINILSPAFAELLTPGDGYTGGEQFFIERRDLVREIPPPEIPVRSAPLTEPPESLFFAMRLFFLGVAAGLMTTDAKGNRSMLVHPSINTEEHRRFYQWVTTTKNEWKTLLAKPDLDQDRLDLIDSFRPAYDDLSKTVTDISSFDSLCSLLLHAVRRTQVEEVNAVPGRTPTIDWNQSYSFILVGGAAVERGYTVKGLTVTYMPRGLGVGNADTVQQRARFFGYKRKYFGYCRVYLEVEVLDAFEEYVAHEQDVRARLLTHRRSGRPLGEWPRAFLLDQDQRPTRANVIEIPYQHGTIGGDWFTPKAPHDSAENVEANRKLVSEFCGGLPFQLDSGHPSRTEYQRHTFVSNLELSDVFRNFLSKYQFGRLRDSQEFVSILVLLKTLLNQPESTRNARPVPQVAIFRMSEVVRERTVDDDDEIPTLFQGEAPVEPKKDRGTVYPGDKAIRVANQITIQIHTLRVVRSEGSIDHVPAIAILIPEECAADLVVQPQGAVR